MITSLEGKVALITGAKGGLGSTVTRAFLDAGATVVGISRSIRDEDFAHLRFIAMPGELESTEAARAVVEPAISRTGKIDVLVHLVGAFAGGNSVAETDAPVLQQMLNTNVYSFFHMAQAVIPHMRSQGSGSIVAVGSRAATEPSPNAGAYSAAKAALVALVRAVAAENASAGISANIVLPGTMDTPANRKAMPDTDFRTWVPTAQVARLIVMLASGELSHVNGAAIPIYGGDL